MTHVCTSEYINGRGLRKFEDKITWLTMICLAKDTVYIHPTWLTTLFWERTNSYDYQSKTTCSTDNTRRVPVTLFKYTTRTVLQFWHAQILRIQETMTKVKYIVSFVNLKIQVRISVVRAPTWLRYICNEKTKPKLRNNSTEHTDTVTRNYGYEL